MTLKLAVSRSRPSVPYGANFCSMAFGTRTKTAEPVEMPL